MHELQVLVVQEMRVDSNLIRICSGVRICLDF